LKFSATVNTLSISVLRIARVSSREEHKILTAHSIMPFCDIRLPQFWFIKNTRLKNI